jgi:hypothetical protein
MFLQSALNNPIFDASTWPPPCTQRHYILLDTNIFSYALPFVENMLNELYSTLVLWKDIGRLAYFFAPYPAVRVPQIHNEYDSCGWQMVLCVAKIVLRELDRLKNMALPATQRSSCGVEGIHRSRQSFGVAAVDDTFDRRDKGAQALDLIHLFGAGRAYMGLRAAIWCDIS